MPKFLQMKNRRGFTPLEIIKDKCFLTRQNNKRSKFLTGFTLIELLVVIAIIGILATIVLVSLDRGRQKARDTKRLGEIREIATAFGRYFSDNGAYPTAAPPTPPDNTIPDTVKAALNPYMLVPDDPKGADWGYRWLDNTLDISNYCVYVQSEAVDTLWFVASKINSGKKTSGGAPGSLDTCVPN